MPKDIQERLAGLKEALKEGFEHTNPARVKMTPDESMEDKTKDIEYFKKKFSEMSDESSKELYPPSKKDIEILKKGMSSNEED